MVLSEALHPSPKLVGWGLAHGDCGDPVGFVELGGDIATVTEIFNGVAPAKQSYRLAKSHTTDRGLVDKIARRKTNLAE